jgi:outer membrane lipoprotein-sorting protein
MFMVMNRLFALVLLLIPCMLSAQKDAVAFLDKAVAKLKADAAVHMDYGYSLYDDAGRLLQKDAGMMRIDGNRYSLLMDNMKVWCDGKTQWSYMRDVNEIYVTSAMSAEAQNLSPLNMMERFRENFLPTLKKEGGKSVVVLDGKSKDAEVGRVVLCFDGESCRLEGMTVYMMNAGHVEVVLSNYAAKCKFAESSYVCPVGEFPGVEIVDMR